VTLYEKADRIGGQLNLARRIPGKEEFHGLVTFYETMLARLGVETRLGSAPGPDELAAHDEVIVATGVLARDPQIPGGDLPHVLGYAAALEGAPVGRRVAIVGAGGIGFDVAQFLAHDGAPLAEDAEAWRAHWGVSDPAEHRGGLAPGGPRPGRAAREITLLQRKAEKPGKRLGKTTGWIHRAELKMLGVRMLSGVAYDRIVPEGLWLRDPEGGGRLIPADSVVICAGQEPARSLADRLAAAGRPAHVIGGADVALELDARRAIDQGARLAATL
jgi:2,4-dienoyl-CoA reductase (NADPH2)